MQVRFWGTRGSVAAPGQATVRYGGNTSCVEVRSQDSVAVLDCGTGARALGGHLAQQGGPLRVHVMLTHFHWDHIQGFPFFFPVFLPTTEVHVYGTGGLEQGLEEAMSGQMQYTYFPVRLTELRSRLNFNQLEEGEFHADRFLVRTQYLNHTCPTLGYRLTAGGTTVAYVTDHEPFWPHNPDLPLAEALAHPGDQRHVAFVAGADLVIHDAQYTAEEYPAKRGWGHSTLEYVVDVAIAAGARRLALFHHDPPRNDAALDVLTERARERVRLRGGTLEVFAAAEGQVIEMEELADTVAVASERPRVVFAPPARVGLIGGAEDRRALREALVEDAYRLSEYTLERPLPDTLHDETDLLVVVPPPGWDAHDVVQAASQKAHGRPVVAVVDPSVDDATRRRVGELAADVVIGPFGPPNLRARVRACLARRQRLPVSEMSGLDPGVSSDSLQLVDRLSSAELQALLQNAARCGFRPGDVLFRQGEAPTGVYYIHTGRVRIMIDAPDGQEVTVGYAGPGDTVGEMSALDGAPRSATAVAVEPVEAGYVARDAFRSVLERAPQTSVRLLRMLVRRLRDVDQRYASGRAAQIAGESPEVAALDAESLTAGQRMDRLQQLLERLDLTQEQLDDLAKDARTARLRVHQWRQAVHALRDVTRLLSPSVTVKDVYRGTVRAINDLVPSKGVAVYVRAEDRLVRVASVGRGMPPGWPADEWPSIVERAMHQSETQVATVEGTRSWMVAIPLRADAGPLGVVTLRRSAPVSDDELALAEVVGAACVLALRRKQVSGDRENGHGIPLVDLESALELEVDRARRLRYPIGVLLSDVGRGRPGTRGNGSWEPSALAPLVRRALRRTDVLAANGSGHLAVILPGIAPEHLGVVELRIQRALDEALGSGAKRMGHRVRTGGSVGQPDAADARRLLDEALSALRGGEPAHDPVTPV